MQKKLSPSQLTKYKKRVERILADQNFIVGKREEKLIKTRTENGRRYFYMVAKRREKDKIVKRFIKVPENSSKKLLIPFERQIEFAKYLKKHTTVKTRDVVADNSDPRRGALFAIMETFPDTKARIGLIEGDKGAELLGEREAKHALDQILKLQAVPIASLPMKLKKILKNNPADYETFSKDVIRFLDKRVDPPDHKNVKECFYKVLERRLKIVGLKNKTKGMLARARSVIDTKTNRIKTLVHGDMAPNNLYVFDSGKVELLDLEWVGVSKNSALALIYDFGNLRARAWNNEKFRNALDNELLRIYSHRGQAELGKTIVRLSILRSHIMLAGFFENYDHAKQKDPLQTRRRISTERDIIQAFS